MIDLHQVRPAGQQPVDRHPYDMRGELVGDLGPVPRRDEHIAARHIDFIGERYRHRIAGPRCIAIAFAAKNPLDAGFPA